MLQVDPWAGPRQWEAPHPLPCPWNELVRTVPLSSPFKDVALKEEGVVEILWVVYVTEPLKTSV